MEVFFKSKNSDTFRDKCCVHDVVRIMQCVLCEYHDSMHDHQQKNPDYFNKSVHAEKHWLMLTME